MGSTNNKAEPARELVPFGSSAIFFVPGWLFGKRSVAFRPGLTAGLALSEAIFFVKDYHFHFEMISIFIVNCLSLSRKHNVLFKRKSRWLTKVISQIHLLKPPSFYTTLSHKRWWFRFELEKSSHPAFEVSLARLFGGTAAAQ